MRSCRGLRARLLSSVLAAGCGLFLTAPASALAADLFVAPSGSDAGSCTASAPCRSFDRAYRVAAPGQTVEVAGGSYGGQSLGADASKTSTADVTFASASGATVTLGGLNIAASPLTVPDIPTGFVVIERTAS